MAKRKQIPTAVRRLVADRDEGRCRYCGSPVAVECHHIVYRSQGGADAQDNLISLCPTHHALVHSNKKQWMPVLSKTLELGRRGKSLSVLQVQRWLERETDEAHTHL